MDGNNYESNTIFMNLIVTILFYNVYFVKIHVGPKKLVYSTILYSCVPNIFNICDIYSVAPDDIMG